MEKGKLKRFIIIASVILAVILISVTYFFVLNNTDRVTRALGNIVDILMPFVIGAVIAYLLKGTCNLFERLFLKLFSKWKKPGSATKEKLANVISIFIAYVIWAIAISTLAYIVVSQVIDSVFQFVNVELPTYIDSFAQFCLQMMREHEFVASAVGEKTAAELNELLTLAPEQKLIHMLEILSGNEMVSGSVNEFIQSGDINPTGIISQVFNGAISAAGILMDAVIGIIISIFILINRKSLARYSTLFLHCVFKSDKIVCAIVDEAKFADRMFGGFLEGKIIDSTIVGLIYYITLELMGVTYAPLIAVTCGVTNIIPIFGPFIGAIPCGFIILATQPQLVIPFIIFVFVCQIIDGYIIDPHIVGGHIKLPAVWVIFAVILFGGLWGFPGLLVGVPTFAVIYDICGKIGTALLKKNGKYSLLVQYRNETKAKKVKKQKRTKKGEIEAVVETEQNVDELNTSSIDVIAETVAESVADKVADSIMDAVAGSMAEAIALAVAENIPENVDVSVADSVTETVKEKLTDSVNEKVVEALTTNKAENSDEENGNDQ